MKIKSIKIEGMNNVDSREYTFENANYFLGSNGSGKTTAMQAIQLALLGYTASSGKQISGIMRHSNNHTMAVTAVLEDKDTSIEIQRIFTRSGKSNKSVVNISPEGYDLDSLVNELELPIFNFASLMSDTANSQQSWWMKFLPPCDTSVDWKSEFKKATETAVIHQKEDVLQDILTSMTEAGVQSSGIRAVQEANTFLKEELSAEKKVDQQLEDTLRSLVHYDDVEENISVESLQTEIQRLENERMQLVKYLTEQDSYKSQKKSLDRQIAELSEDVLSEDSLNQIKLVLQTQRDRLEELNKSSTSLKSDIQSIRAEIHNLDKMKAASMCPVLKISCDKLGDVIDDSDSQKEKLEKKASELEKKLNEAVSQYSKDLAYYNQGVDKYNSALASQAKLTTLQQTSLNPPEVVDMKQFQCKSEEEYNSTISQMQQTLHEVIANQSYSELYDKVKTDTMLSQSRIALLKLLISHTNVNALQNQLMSKQFEQFESAMLPFIQAAMGSNCAPKFHLSEKSSDFSFGIQRNSSYIPYSMLSSGEKCIFAVAMMISVVSMSSSKLKLVMIDDMLDHLDNEKLHAAMQGIHSAEHIQFIFAGVMDVSQEDINIIYV